VSSQNPRKPYPADVSDEEWALVAPYLTLMTPEAPKRLYDLREVFNGLRYVVKTGGPWRWRPHDLPPRTSFIIRRNAGSKRACSNDSSRICAPCYACKRDETRRHSGQPRPAVDARKRGTRRLRRSQVSEGQQGHSAVDTLGHLLALHVTPAHEQDRAQVSELAAQVQPATGENVELAYVDQGYTGEEAIQAAQQHGIQLEVVKLSEAKKGFVLLPKRWVVERSFGWATRFRRLVRDYECLPQTVAGLHCVVFACLFLQRFVAVLTPS